LEKLLQNFRLDVCRGKYRVARLTLGIRRGGLSEQELLDGSRCIGLVNLALTLEEIGYLVQEDWDVLVGELVSEHVDELNASSFELAKIIDFAVLKLRQHQVLQVVPE
jgi:hypothetical protein